MKFTDEIDSRISFIEIIEIIVNEHLQRSCNKYFWAYAYLKLRIILTFADRFFSSTSFFLIFLLIKSDKD